MATFHLLLHFQCKEIVQSRVLTVTISQNDTYERQQLVSDIATLFQDMDHRLTHPHIDQYVIVNVKTEHGWIEVPTSATNLSALRHTLHVEIKKLIELRVEFVENMELKYIATEFSSQLLDAALLSDRINEEGKMENSLPTCLEVKLGDELKSFDNIIRSEHYLELSFGLKYYLAVKDHLLFVAIQCTNHSPLGKHELETLTNALNIDYLHKLIDKKIYCQLIFCGYGIGGLVARLVTNKLLEKQQQADRRSHRALQWSNRDLLCVTFGGQQTVPAETQPSSVVADKVLGSYFVHLLHTEDNITSSSPNEKASKTSFGWLQRWRSASSSSKEHQQQTSNQHVTLLFGKGMTAELPPKLFLSNELSHNNTSSNNNSNSMARYHQTCLDFVHAFAFISPRSQPMKMNPLNGSEERGAEIVSTSSKLQPVSPSSSPLSLCRLMGADEEECAGMTLLSVVASVFRTRVDPIIRSTTSIATSSSTSAPLNDITVKASAYSILLDHLLGLMVCEEADKETEGNGEEDSDEKMMRYLRSCAIMGRHPSAVQSDLAPVTNPIMNLFHAIHPSTKQYHKKERLIAIVLATVALKQTTCPYELYLVMKQLFTRCLTLSQQVPFYPFLPSLLDLFPTDSPWLSPFVSLVKHTLVEVVPKYPIAEMVYPATKQGMVEFKIRHKKSSSSSSSPSSSLSVWRKSWRSAWLKLERGYLFYFACSNNNKGGTSSPATTQQQLITVHYLKGFSILNENPTNCTLLLASTQKRLSLRFTGKSALEDFLAWKTALQLHLDLFPPPSRSLVSTRSEEIL